MSPPRFARLLVLTSAIAFLLPTFGPAALHSPSAQTAEDPFVPVTDAMLEDPAPGDWLTWRRTPNGWGYSPLDQVNRENVGELRMVWTRALATGGQEGTPLAYGGTLYFPNPNDVLQAIDAVTGDLKWEYRRDIPDDAPQVLGGAMLVSVNRNVAIYGRTIIDTGNDGYVYAVDAATGKLAWETEIFDYDTTPTRHTAGPMIANGKVISGRSCRPRAGPDTCAIVAHDAATGEERWRRRLIPAPGEPGDETWGGVPYEKRLHVGSWMVPSYDPELDLVYVGTSVTSPAPKFLLGGVDNKHLYHNSTLALDGDTPRRVVAKVEHHRGELFPRVGFIVTNMTLPSRSVVRFYNKRGTAEPWIKEGKQATHWTRLSCHRFRANEVRLHLSVLAYNLGNLWRRLVLPPRIKRWSLTSLQQRLVKTGGRLVKHARYYWLLLAEGHLTRRLFGDMLRRIWALPVPGG